MTSGSGWRTSARRRGRRRMGRCTRVRTCCACCACCACCGSGMAWHCMAAFAGALRWQCTATPPSTGSHCCAFPTPLPPRRHPRAARVGRPAVASGSDQGRAAGAGRWPGHPHAPHLPGEHPHLPAAGECEGQQWSPSWVLVLRPGCSLRQNARTHQLSFVQTQPHIVLLVATIAPSYSPFCTNNPHLLAPLAGARNLHGHVFGSTPWLFAAQDPALSHLRPPPPCRSATCTAASLAAFSCGGPLSWPFRPHTSLPAPGRRQVRRGCTHNNTMQPGGGWKVIRHGSVCILWSGAPDSVCADNLCQLALPCVQRRLERSSSASR